MSLWLVFMLSVAAGFVAIVVVPALIAPPNRRGLVRAVIIVGLVCSTLVYLIFAAHTGNTPPVPQPQH